MTLAEYAQSFVGKVKYVFGSDNVPGGKADCSSFTQYIYRQYGVNIGRTTEQQWSKGTTVNKSDLKDGDLILFKNTWNSGYKDGVSHVGIYIGDNKFVHNSSSGGVKISDLSESYYQQHYLGAKRIDGISSNNIGGSSTGNNSSVNSNSKTGIDLVWWGDLILVIFSVGLFIFGIFFFAGIFK